MLKFGLWNFGRKWTNQSWIVASYYKLVPQPIVTKCTTISAEEAYVSSCTQLLYIPDAEHLTYMYWEGTTELGKWIRIWYKRILRRQLPRPLIHWNISCKLCIPHLLLQIVHFFLRFNPLPTLKRDSPPPKHSCSLTCFTDTTFTLYQLPSTENGAAQMAPWWTVANGNTLLLV